ncbi:MAG: CHAT domain-containing protein [Nostoc sp. NMS1]|uniref:CHAT domain-containing protein n=1 Tax=unclassified Nostoc TaxID=2593658 RepID=UPI0025EAE00C|nr:MULTISPECIES: CHAT domain-containing protein [unclassified Nostoc]MBN3905586.1 CHAT domain-containing protein [Nostoc sp. NMS1]MBN3992470.1 CHAT domain-containing protein [Nostoc sp. NMS2]
MARKKSRLRKIKGLLSVLLLLAMFLGAGLLPPTFAHITAEKSIVQSLPNAQNLVEQGRKYYEAERFAQAATFWQQAISAFKANKDQLGQAMTLGNLSLTYQQLGRWAEAEDAITQSLNLLQTQKDSSQVLAQLLDIKGRLLLIQNKAEDALNTWQQAASIYQKLNDTNSILSNRINQAQALQTLGFYRQAEKTLKESIQILQKQPNSPLKVTGLRSLGNVVQVTGDLKTSQQILQQSLEVAASLPDKQAVGDILLSLGNTARAQQDVPAAIEFYRQSANAATSATTRIQAQVNELKLLLETKQFSALTALSSQIQTQLSDLPASRTAIFTRINFAQTLTLYKKTITADTPSWLNIAQQLSVAIEQARNLEDKRTESYATGVLGGVYEQTQQWTDAQNLTQQALLMAQAIDAKDIAYRWQWQLGRLLKVREDIKGAIEAYTEAVGNLQALRSDLVAVNSAVKFSFREEVEPVYRQLVDLLLQSQGNSQLSFENLEKASNTIELLQIAELENFFRNNCLNAQIRNPKKDPTAAIVYPFILPDRLEVIVELPQQRWLHYTTPVVEKELETTLAQLQENLPKPHTLRQVQSLSQKVYKWLIQPAEAALVETKTPTLVFVLDGWLRNIPMAALYDGKQYLVEKYNIALTPSLQLIEPKPFEKELKAIVAGLSEASSGFSALPNVKLELEEIRSQVPSSILLNQEFTSKTLQNRINSLSFPIVHLATHGQFSSKAEETFLVAWNERIYVKKLNELVQTLEQNRPEAIELLILSACQTAAGDEQAALGIAGVAFQAGARSTIASLWNLDDESTAVLMSQFYQELANKNLTKAEVLRHAQLALLQNPKYKRPRFWAPYVLLGNWL